jgi:hypothetical protein
MAIRGRADSGAFVVSTAFTARSVLADAAFSTSRIAHSTVILVGHKVSAGRCRRRTAHAFYAASAGSAPVAFACFLAIAFDFLAFCSGKTVFVLVPGRTGFAMAFFVFIALAQEFVRTFLLAMHPAVLDVTGRTAIFASC